MDMQFTCASLRCQRRADCEAYLFHGKRVGEGGQTRHSLCRAQSATEGPFTRNSHFAGGGFAHVADKPGMSRAAFQKILPRLIQAQVSIDGRAHFRRVRGVQIAILAIVLPPAHRAKSQRLGRVQRQAVAARASKSNLQECPHLKMDDEPKHRFTGVPARFVRCVKIGLFAQAFGSRCAALTDSPLAQSSAVSPATPPDLKSDRELRRARKPGPAADPMRRAMADHPSLPSRIALPAG